MLLVHRHGQRPSCPPVTFCFNHWRPLVLSECGRSSSRVVGRSLQTLGPQSATLPGPWRRNINQCTEFVLIKSTTKYASCCTVGYIQNFPQLLQLCFMIIDFTALWFYDSLWTGAINQWMNKWIDYHFHSACNVKVKFNDKVKDKVTIKETILLEN